jgi:hypothetical protein
MRALSERRDRGQRFMHLLSRELFTLFRHLSLTATFAVLTIVAVPRHVRLSDPGTVTRVLLVAFILVALGSSGYTNIRIRRAFALCRKDYAAFTRGELCDVRAAWHPGLRSEQRTWLVERWVLVALMIEGIVFIGAITWTLSSLFVMTQGSALLLLYRAKQLDSGLSPALPLLLCCVMLAGWCTWHLNRIALLHETTAMEECFPYRYGPRRREGGRDKLRRHIMAAVYDIRSGLSRILPDVPAAEGRATVAVIGLTLAAAVVFPVPASLEPLVPGHIFTRAPFDIVFRLGIFATFAAVVWAISRLVVVWWSLRTILRCVGSTPLVTAFERLPRRISRLTRFTLHSDPSRTTVDTITATQWTHLRRLFAAYCRTKREEAKAPNAKSIDRLPCAARIGTLLSSTLPLRADAHRVATTTLAPQLTELWQILIIFWQREPTSGQSQSLIDGPKEKITTPSYSTSGRIRRDASTLSRLWLRTAEEFVAAQVIDYVAWVIRSLRRIVILLLFMIAVMAALVSSYVYAPETAVRTGLIVLVAGIVGALVTVLVQMNRDEVLSRVMRTDPGRVTWDGNFVTNVLVVTVIPLLSLMGSSLPWLQHGLFGWIDPLFRLVTKQ